MSIQNVYIDHKPGVGLMTMLGISPEEVRYKGLISDLKGLVNKCHRYKFKSITNFEKSISHISHEIQTYGFDFVPTHYITPFLEELETYKNVLSSMVLGYEKTKD